MEKQLICLFLGMLFSLSSFAQIDFEKGYFIDNSGQRTECFIRNIEWLNNPDKIEYRLTPEGNTNEIGSAEISEFGIDQQSRYIKRKVAIDVSTDDLKTLSTERAPNFENKELLLKVLVEGKASLYSYSEQNFTKYFYSLDGAEITQLIYKRFLYETEKTIRKPIFIKKGRLLKTISIDNNC